MTKYLYEIAFSPTTEMIKVVMKNNLQNVDGSLKTKIPISTVPMAPIPVQTGYAGPYGIVWVALASDVILKTEKAIKPPIHPPPFYSGNVFCTSETIGEAYFAKPCDN